MSRRLDVLSAVQTRSGMQAVKEIWLDRMDFCPWADYTLIQTSLWETDSIIFPLFALKYEWNGTGNVVYS